MISVGSQILYYLLWIFAIFYLLLISPSGIPVIASTKCISMPLKANAGFSRKRPIGRLAPHQQATQNATATVTVPTS